MGPGRERRECCETGVEEDYRLPTKFAVKHTHIHGKIFKDEELGTAQTRFVLS